MHAWPLHYLLRVVTTDPRIFTGGSNFVIALTNFRLKWVKLQEKGGKLGRVQVSVSIEPTFTYYSVYITVNNDLVYKV